MHWKDIVVKQYADIEQEIRIGPYRANLAKHYVATNGDIKTLIGEAGRDHEVRAYSYEESFNDKTTTIAASDSLSVGATLTTSVTGATSATFGNNVTANITGSLTANMTNRFDIVGHYGLIGNYAAGNNPAAYISFTTLMLSDTELGGGIDIDGDTSLFAKADAVSIKATESMTLASEGSFNIERKYNVSAISVDDIVMHNYNGNILLDTKAKAGPSATAATTGGVAELSKDGYIVLRTNESYSKRITISESANADLQNPERTRIGGIELRAEDSSISLIVGKDSSLNSQGLFVDKYSNNVSVQSKCDDLILTAKTYFNISAMGGTLEAGVSTNSTTNTLEINSGGNISLTTRYSTGHIDLTAGDIRLATSHLILDNNSTTGAVYGTGNPTGTATEGRIYFKIIS